MFGIWLVHTLNASDTTGLDQPHDYKKEMYDWEEMICLKRVVELLCTSLFAIMTALV
jgi:hypothetical protein